MRRHRFLRADTGEDLDPLSSLTNLFDVAMVFAVALMVALVEHLNLAEGEGCVSEATVVFRPRVRKLGDDVGLAATSEDHGEVNIGC